MWAFDVTPAKLPEIYWSHSLDEIQGYARMRLSWFQARAFQDHEVLRIIVKQSFGGKPSEANVVEHTPQSKQEAIGMLGMVMKR